MKKKSIILLIVGVFIVGSALSLLIDKEYYRAINSVSPYIIVTITYLVIGVLSGVFVKRITIGKKAIYVLLATMLIILFMILSPFIAISVIGRLVLDTNSHIFLSLTLGQLLACLLRARVPTERHGDG